jgi:hypothetical protein
MHRTAQTTTQATMSHCARRSARRGEGRVQRRMGIAMLKITTARRISFATGEIST